MVETDSNMHFDAHDTGEMLSFDDINLHERYVWNGRLVQVCCKYKQDKKISVYDVSTNTDLGFIDYQCLNQVGNNSHLNMFLHDTTDTNPHEMIPAYNDEICASKSIKYHENEASQKNKKANCIAMLLKRFAIERSKYDTNKFDF